MKKLIAATALILAFSNIAQAKSVANCAFGETTADLSDRLEETGKGKALYKGEHLSLHKEVRLGGLTQFEKKMILEVMGETGSIKQGEEALKAFSKADGYITYFQHNSNGREFAQVASYPGDNEFGMIFEIKRLERKNDYTIYSVAAVISDGDIVDCVVEYEKP